MVVNLLRKAFKGIALFALPVIILFGCASGDKKNNVLVIDEAITPLPLFEKDKYDSLVSPGKIIKAAIPLKFQLSGIGNSIVAEAASIFVADHKYYVWDKKFSGLKVFDENGNYLFQVGKVGKGPGEYIKIFDVKFVDSSRIILLCDAVNLLYFDLAGNYLKTTSLGMFAYTFSITPTGDFLFYINNNFSEKSKQFNVVLTDSTIKVLDRFFESEMKDDPASFDYTGFLNNDIGNSLYAIPFDDKVFAFNGGAFRVQYKFNLGANKLAESIINNNVRSRAAERRKADYIGSEFFEGQHYLFFSYKEDDRILYGILDKQKNTLNTALNIERTDDYLSRLFYVPLGRVGDTLLVGVQPEKIIYLRDTHKDYLEMIKVSNKPLYDMIQSFHATDNMVLLKCVLK
ncbi:6-bladed beta-propeller [Paraflavitalea sp. CAU 1676]|uniref:6-bladed beta-propeller n=1 Tax=Paraflavitalea sp. CAU 1676 TaxID=3032598 RepID=UPI0023DA9B5A|nr:6-bladed beta-propeller [Paraflavitalea sp. CAU 1676]MDF2191994.1 6-bladed beta-propeller [Paraflavitalea sp. CAU 1676]